MKVVYLTLISSISLLVSTQAQTLALWPLNDQYQGSARVFINDLTASDFERGNGIGALNFSSSGVNATGWAEVTPAANTVDFYQFGIEGSGTSTFALSALKFKERRSSTGPLSFYITYSKDNFKTETILTQEVLADDINWREYTFPLDIKLTGQEELLFRLYAHDAESSTGSWTIKSNTLELLGTAMPTCSAPLLPPGVQVVTPQEEAIEIVLNGGGGDGRLYVLSTQNELIKQPYQGETYTGSTIYEQGESLGNTSYVIKSSDDPSDNFTITGLIPGEAYSLAIFEYNDTEMCYAKTPLTINFTTNCGNTPRSIVAMQRSALEQKVALRWQDPNCFDQLLIVASTDEITGAPTGIDFDDDAAFGTGNPASGFNGDVYTVYFGDQANTKIVDNLANGTNYYFAVYVRLGNQWSDAYRFSAQPVASCPAPYTERLFINEFHYINSIVSQDQGVEIAGPAGQDLSNYSLVIYERTGTGEGSLDEVKKLDLDGFLANESSGLGAKWFPIPAMPLKRGYVQLINTITEDVVDFVSYDPLSGITDQHTPSSDATEFSYESLLENESIPAGSSLQRVGEGDCPTDFQWMRLPQTRDQLNTGQALLPVLITTLDAEASGNHARIYWQTAAEVNSDYFVIERSNDGRIFHKIATIGAAGYSQVFIDYEHYDHQPLAGINYYRLRQVDFDGTEYDHGIVTVNFTGDSKIDLQVYPNPVVNEVTISWSSPIKALQLSDAFGRRLHQVALTTEDRSLTLDMTPFKPGIYFIQLENQHGLEALKLIKR